jgi:hypothetical protein
MGSESVQASAVLVKAQKFRNNVGVTPVLELPYIRRPGTPRWRDLCKDMISFRIC